MNREDDFWHSINVLATAFFEGDLRHGSCNACAVGNLVRDVAEDESTDLELSRWGYDQYWLGPLRRGNEPAPDLPYDFGEILLIEAAFEDFRGQREHSLPPVPEEQADQIGTYDTDDGQLDGLLRVVDALFVIHDVTDDDLRADAKAALDGDYETVDAVL